MECCFCCCTKETSGVSVKTNLIFIVTFQLWWVVVSYYSCMNHCQFFSLCFKLWCWVSPHFLATTTCQKSIYALQVMSWHGSMSDMQMKSHFAWKHWMLLRWILSACSFSSYSFLFFSLQCLWWITSNLYGGTSAKISSFLPVEQLLGRVMHDALDSRDCCSSNATTPVFADSCGDATRSAGECTWGICFQASGVLACNCGKRRTWQCTAFSSWWGCLCIGTLGCFVSGKGKTCWSLELDCLQSIV